jgi:hypothetical protein
MTPARSLRFGMCGMPEGLTSPGCPSPSRLDCGRDHRRPRRRLRPGRVPQSVARLRAAGGCGEDGHAQGLARRLTSSLGCAIWEQTSNQAAPVRPLYDARIRDLGPGDFVKVEPTHARRRGGNRYHTKNNPRRLDATVLLSHERAIKAAIWGVAVIVRWPHIHSWRSRSAGGEPRHRRRCVCKPTASAASRE